MVKNENVLLDPNSKALWGGGMEENKAMECQYHGDVTDSVFR